MKVPRAVAVLTELRERGDATAAVLVKRKLKQAELEELVELNPPLVSRAVTSSGRLYGITGYGQRWLQSKEKAK